MKRSGLIALSHVALLIILTVVAEIIPAQPFGIFVAAGDKFQASRYRAFVPSVSLVFQNFVGRMDHA